MATQRLRCRTCRVQFSRPLGSRRIYCEGCRPPRAVSQPSEVTPLHVETPTMGDLEQVTHDQLDQAGSLDTVDGRSALYAARQLDAGGHTGSQTAALLRELRSAAVAALAGARRSSDGLDEIARRRHARASSA